MFICLFIYPSEMILQIELSIRLIISEMIWLIFSSKVNPVRASFQGSSVIDVFVFGYSFASFIEDDEVDADDDDNDNDDDDDADFRAFTLTACDELEEKWECMMPQTSCREVNQQLNWRWWKSFARRMYLVQSSFISL